MKTGVYDCLMVVKYDGVIDTVSCHCASGRGPHSSCKHTAALCYAICDFVSNFLSVETALSCTEKLQKWNVPRSKVVEAVPVYEMHFEKKKFAKSCKELVGKRPSDYSIGDLCPTDEKAARTFIDDLQNYQDQTGHVIGLLQVIDKENPVKPVNDESNSIPIKEYLYQIDNCIGRLKLNANLTLNEKCEEVLIKMQVQKELIIKIEEFTRQQSGCRTWFDIRKKKITASKCFEIVTFTGRNSPDRLVRNIINPSVFSTKATRFGLEHETDVIEHYKIQNPDVIVETSGFHIDSTYGFLGCSPDGILTEPNVGKGVLECKAPISFSDQTLDEALLCKTYPLQRKSEIVNGNVKIYVQLKRNNKYYHQIQLQLYCCRKFAGFCDFALLHVHSKYLYVERVLPDKEWFTQNIKKFETFYKEEVVPRLLT